MSTIAALHGESSDLANLILEQAYTASLFGLPPDQNKLDKLLGFTAALPCLTSTHQENVVRDILAILKGVKTHRDMLVAIEKIEALVKRVRARLRGCLEDGAPFGRLLLRRSVPTTIKSGDPLSDSQTNYDRLAQTARNFMVINFVSNVLAILDATRTSLKKRATELTPAVNMLDLTPSSPRVTSGAPAVTRSSETEPLDTKSTGPHTWFGVHFPAGKSKLVRVLEKYHKDGATEVGYDQIARDYNAYLLALSQEPINAPSIGQALRNIVTMFTDEHQETPFRVPRHAGKIVFKNPITRPVLLDENPLDASTLVTSTTVDAAPDAAEDYLDADFDLSALQKPDPIVLKPLTSAALVSLEGWGDISVKILTHLLTNTGAPVLPGKLAHDCGIQLSQLTMEIAQLYALLQGYDHEIHVDVHGNISLVKIPQKPQ